MKQTGSQDGVKQAQEGRAVTKYVRMSPRKMRLVLDAIRWQPVSEAFSILANLKKKAARIVTKTLKSAVANAKQKEMDEARLRVEIAFADGGPSFKRYLPRSMGRADTLLKRTTHVTIAVKEGLLKRETVATKGKHEKAPKAELPEKTKAKDSNKKEAAAAA